MARLEDLPLRDDLKGQQPYGAPQLDVAVSLNVNENTHRVPLEVAEDIIQRLAKSLMTINRYPDREFMPLREALASYLGADLKPENIWAANGSNEVLQHIFQAFGGPGRKFLSFTPTYSMYPIIASGTQTEYDSVPRADRFELTPAQIRSAILEHKPNIVILCAPNNPTGTPLGLDCIEAAYEAITEASGGVLVVDEAYQEFGADPSVTAISLLAGRERLLVSRTMSKAFAFAGARVGYLAADPAVIDAL
ncbi:MAG: aminotransferase class I/II-fold pyridoxal phosphate-dependent enzyme, partial [Rhodoluna sp.]